MSVLLTRMQNFRANSPLDRWETRITQMGAFSLMRNDGNSPGSIVTPELIQRAREAVGNTLETPVIDFDASIAIGNVANVVIADSENNSAMHTISFTRYAWGFTQVPSAFSNNELSIQRDFDAKMNKYLSAAANVIETASVTALSTAKTQILADDLGQFTLTNDVAVNAAANAENLTGDLGPLLAGNDFPDIFTRVVGNQSYRSHMNKTVVNHGEFNTTNETYQTADKEFYFSNKITNAAGQSATGFIVVPGSTGIIPRFEREAMMALSMPGGVNRARTGHEWSVVEMPLLGIPVGTFYYESVGDQNNIVGAATADLTRGIKQHFGWCVDLAFITPYNSDRSAVASPIIQFANATS